MGVSRMFRKRRSHREILARIERLERENAALTREIEVALAPPPPKKDPEWREGGVVELAARLAYTEPPVRPDVKWPVGDAATVNYVTSSAVAYLPLDENGYYRPKPRVALPPGVQT